MAKPSVSEVISNRPLAEIEYLASNIQDNIYQEISFAAGGVKTIGNILFSNASGAIEGMNETDVQGLSLAVESLGHYLEMLSTRLEVESMKIQGKVRELVGQV